MSEGVDPIEFHPLADMFPLIDGDEFDDLAGSIRKNGQREAIILFDGKILDGRNRYRACLAAKIAPRFQYLPEGVDPVDFVIDHNLRRRHLSESQRASVAAKIANLSWGGARKDQGANLRLEAPVSRAEAAQRLSVSERSVDTASVVVERGVEELGQMVDAGKASVSAAAAIARLDPDAQRAAIEEIAASPDGRRTIKSIAKRVRAEEQARRHTERQDRAETIAAKNPDLPAGRAFAFVLIDVPRHHENYSHVTGSEKAPENHYPTMRFEELIDFPIDRFAAPTAIIAFWSTAASLLDDLDILAEWGFVAMRPRDGEGRLLRSDDGRPLPAIGKGHYGSHQIWRKIRAGRQTGTGRWFFDQHEMLIIARRGDVPAPLPGTQPESVLSAEVTDHSTKPGEQVRAWVDRCWPNLSKIEVFARGAPPPGWVFWGNQVTDSEKPHELPRRKKRKPEPIARPLPVLVEDIPAFLRVGHPENTWRKSG